MDSEADVARIEIALQRLVGTTIKRLSFEEPGLDCTIDFDNDLQLKLFCGSTTPGCSNYRLRSEDVSYSVDAYSSLLVLKRHSG